MSSFMMPYISKRKININAYFANDENTHSIKQETSPIVLSHSLYHYLKVLKDNIDDVQKDWNTYKRYTNPYEAIHTYSLGNGGQPVCSLKPISRSFFKMIEICNMFDLLKTMPENMRSFHIAEGPGGFIEALSGLRNNADDEYVGMTLISDDTHVPGWRKSQKFLNANSNVKIETGIDGTGNITKYENLLFCSGKYGASMDLITADGGFDFSTDYNTQENQVGELLVSQVAFASAMQKKGGIFILKVFDLFTKLSVEVMYLLSIMYEKVHVVKPHTSRYANSERYVVAQGFRAEDGRTEWTIQFAPIFEKMNQLSNTNQQTTNNTNTNNKPATNIEIISILDKKEEIPKYYLNRVEECNASIGQQQMDTISNTLTLIKNPRQDKIEKIKTSNIQKCVLWCQKHKLPYDKDVRNYNMFLSAKNKVSKLPKKMEDETDDCLTNSKEMHIISNVINEIVSNIVEINKTCNTSDIKE